jgi:hypothetical protein
MQKLYIITAAFQALLILKPEKCEFRYPTRFKGQEHEHIIRQTRWTARC